MSDFGDYLRAHSAHVFRPAGGPCSPETLDEAEKKLAIRLPASYRTFLTELGPGEWCDEIVAAPDQLYAFDEETRDMEGFVALVHNVGGVGNFVAIDPEDPEKDGERPVYFCGHDPMAYGRVADSFEAWAKGRAEGCLGGDPVNLYEQPVTLIDPRPKKWWQFWR